MIWSLQSQENKFKVRSRILWFWQYRYHDVKYLPSSFNDNILFILPHVTLRVLNTYGSSMNGMDKNCEGHPWCITKTTNIQNNFGLSFRRSTCACHLQYPNDNCDYMHHNGGLLNNTKWIGSTPLPFFVVMFPILGLLLSVRYVVSHMCALFCVMLE